MRQILKSRIVNNKVYYIALNKCLPEHSYLIWFYWDPNYRYIIRNILYEGNQINKESIVEALTK